MTTNFWGWYSPPGVSPSHSSTQAPSCPCCPGTERICVCVCEQPHLMSPLVPCSLPPFPLFLCIGGASCQELKPSQVSQVRVRTRLSQESELWQDGSCTHLHGLGLLPAALPLSICAGGSSPRPAGVTAYTFQLPGIRAYPLRLPCSR